MYRPPETHVFQDGDHRIAFLAEDLRFFEIDDLAEAILEACGGRTRAEVIRMLSGRWSAPDIAAALGEMEEARILASGPPSPPVTEEGLHDPGLVNVSLHVSHACNLKCDYCFAGGGAYGGKPAQMEPEVARKAVDWTLAGCRPAGHAHINFLGGEPLMNFPLIREVVSYARSRAKDLGLGVSFGITTNGTLLKGEVARFLADADIQVVISVDAPHPGGGCLRPFRDGTDSHGAVAENARRAIEESPDRVTLRATLTSANLDIKGTLQHLRELGDAGTIQVGMVNESPDRPWGIREEHLPEIRRRLRELRDYCVERLPADASPPGFGSFEGLMLQLFTRSSSRYGCSGGRKMVSITVDGSIYFCSSLVGREEFRMGHVSSGLDAGRREALLERLRVTSKAACRACWARHLCGGGCAHDAALTGPDPFTPNPVRCDIIRTSYELAMGICQEMEERDPGWLEARFSRKWDAAGAA